MEATNEMIIQGLVGKRILIVEDDDFFRNAMGSYLQKKGFHVTMAADGLAAKEVCDVHVFDLILSDVQMPNLDGISFLKWAKANCKTKDVPFILVTGFTDVLETQTAYDLGADEFIAKPFRNADLIGVVAGILLPDSHAERPQALSTDRFHKVGIEEFLMRKKVDFEVYVRLSHIKMVRIGRAGDDVPVERIRAYQERGLRYLYIAKEDFSKLIAMTEQPKVEILSSKIDPLKKYNFILYTGDTILEKVLVLGVDLELFADTREIFMTIIELIGQNDAHFRLLQAMKEHSESLYVHGLATAMYSLMIARRMGHTSSQTFYKLAMAGLFHDIGCQELPAEIVNKLRSLLRPEERAILETHTARGIEILAKAQNISTDVLEIIAQHHEDLMGEGYPAALSKNQIHPLARILAVADVITEFIVPGVQHLVLKGPEAVKYIEKAYGTRLDREALEALKAIFDVETMSVA